MAYVVDQAHVMYANLDHGGFFFFASFRIFSLSRIVVYSTSSPATYSSFEFLNMLLKQARHPLTVMDPWV